MSQVLPDGVSQELVVATAIAQLRERPLHTLSLESVAASLGVRRGTVGMHFPTWEALLIAVVAEWNQRRLEPLIPVAGQLGAVAFLRAVIEANAADPAHLRLLIGAANIAAFPGLPAAAWLTEQYLAFYALVEQALKEDLKTGREQAHIGLADGAGELIALYEGLSLQSLVRPEMDTAVAFDRAVARLRRGWVNSLEDEAIVTSSSGSEVAGGADTMGGRA